VLAWAPSPQNASPKLAHFRPRVKGFILEAEPT